jgi:hypothetical protein
MHADFWLEILKRGCHGEFGRIQLAFKKVCREDVKLIYQALANTVMNVRVPEKDGNILTI